MSKKWRRGFQNEWADGDIAYTFGWKTLIPWRGSVKRADGTEFFICWSWFGFVLTWSDDG